MADGLRGRGARARLDGSRLTLERVSGEEYDMLRDVIVDSGALLYRLAPARHSSRTSSRRSRRGGRNGRERGAAVTSGPAEVFDLGYQGYEGVRTDRWARRLRDLAGRDRISLRLRPRTGAKIALAAPRPRPRPGGGARLRHPRSSAPRPTRTTSSFRRTRVPRVGDGAAALFAAVVAPLDLPDRRDGVLALYAARPITPFATTSGRVRRRS